MQTKHECRFIAKLEDIDENNPCGECRFITKCNDAIMVDPSHISGNNIE